MDSSLKNLKLISLYRVQQIINAADNDLKKKKLQLDGDSLLLLSRVRVVNISAFLRRTALFNPERVNKISVV